MMDLKNPKWMYAKAVMFIVIGLISFALVVAEHPSIKVAALLLLMIWSFSRAYYFTFYVIEKYVDPEYKFSGLIDFLRYLVRREKKPSQKVDSINPS